MSARSVCLVTGFVLACGALATGRQRWLPSVRQTAAPPAVDATRAQRSPASPHAPPIRLALADQSTRTAGLIPALQFASDVQRDVCACTDRACLKAVNQRYGALAGQQAPLDPVDAPTFVDITRATRPCVQRILDAEVETAPGAVVEEAARPTPTDERAVQPSR
jgi:hypothetical protein